MSGGISVQKTAINFIELIKFCLRFEIEQTIENQYRKSLLRFFFC